MNTVSEFHAEAPQATVSEGLAQGPYMAARAGFGPTTLRTKGAKSNDEPPCPICCSILANSSGRLRISALPFCMSCT